MKRGMQLSEKCENVKRVKESSVNRYLRIEKCGTSQWIEWIGLPENWENTKQVKNGSGTITQELKNCKASQQTKRKRYPRTAKMQSKSKTGK